MEKSSEVFLAQKRMKKTDIDLRLDVHGYEGLPHKKNTKRIKKEYKKRIDRLIDKNENEIKFVIQVSIKMFIGKV